MKKQIFIIFILIFLIAGQNVASAYTMPNINFWKKGVEQKAAINEKYLNISWWKKFNDPILTENLTKVFDNNNDLKIATLRVKENERLVKISIGAQLPSITFDGTISRVMRSSDSQFGADMVIPTYAQNQFNFPLIMTYEADIWGTNFLAMQSQKRQLEMVRQDEKSLYIALLSGFTATYYNLIKVDKLIEIQEDLIATQSELTKKAEKKYKGGLCGINEFLAEQKNLTYMTAELENLKEQQTFLENQMNVLLSNREFTRVTRSAYKDVKMLSNLPDKVSVDAIQGRPDIKKAQENIKRINYDVRIAKRSFLPRIILTGDIGTNAYNISQLFRSNTTFAGMSIIPVWDIFQGGRKIQILKLRKHQFEEANEAYKKTILTAIKELNDSIYALNSQNKTYGIIKERNRLEQEQYSLKVKEERIGMASEMDVLAHREAILMTEKAEVSSKIDSIISVITLYKAVGGQDITKIDGDL